MNDIDRKFTLFLIIIITYGNPSPTIYRVFQKKNQIGKNKAEANDWFTT